MMKLRRHVDGADLGDAADVVAAEIEQHQVLGALLGIGEQHFGLSAWSSASVGATAARAGDRADGDLAVAHAHEDLGARADEGEGAEIEVEEERRGVECGAARGRARTAAA